MRRRRTDGSNRLASMGSGAAWTLSLLCIAASSCADRRIYKAGDNPYIENKVTVSGRICTDDPAERGFPVKVLFVIDNSTSMQSNDPYAETGSAVSEALESWGKNPRYHFGLIGFAAGARSLIKGGFTQDAAALSGAVQILRRRDPSDSFARCSTDGRCRDLRGALGRAANLIGDGVLSADPGLAARTSYVVLLLASGPPVPAVSRCDCRDREAETLPERWGACPWTECDDPGAAAAVPDTFSQWTLPAEHSLDPSRIRAVDPSQTAGPCEASCVYYPGGGGQPGSCEERVLVNTVREIKQLALDNGAAGFALHSFYLPDAVDYSTMPQNLFAPPCGSAADHARAEQLLGEMAFAGDGSYTKVATAAAVRFVDLEQQAGPAHLLFKELVVSNRSVLSTGEGLQPDSDQDGLADASERSIGTCPSDPDSDGDGINDLVEVRLAFDPLQQSDPVECLDLERTSITDTNLCGGGEKTWVVFDDADGDSLNACEERLLGTMDSLFDSDADGLPDHLELAAGTSYQQADPLADIDFDGLHNRIEVRQHTDPRSNDVQSQLELAYRYSQEDEGTREMLWARPLVKISGVQIARFSPESSPGAGVLQFEPGPPPTLRWRDPHDLGTGGDFGPPVEVGSSDQQVTLTSCHHDGSGGCTEESSQRQIIVRVEPGLLGVEPTTEKVYVKSATRNCIRFRVANITLLETEADPWSRRRGTNRIDIYFAQTPPHAKAQAGSFRGASLLVTYLEEQGRTPALAEINFSDDDFSPIE